MVRWARYLNRYAHIPFVIIGGHSAIGAIMPNLTRRGPYRYIRRQAKQRFVAANAKRPGGEVR